MRLYSWLLMVLLTPLPALAQPSFTVVPLGVKGGVDESNLSAYLVAPAGASSYVCLDAGTVYSGVERAIANRVFVAPAGEVVRTHIKAYLVSHAHLDHVAGLLLGAPDDAPKPIYGLPTALATLQNDYFNWRAWPNFGDGGNPPALNKYQLRPLTPGQEVALQSPALNVRAFALSHGPATQSAAFLVRSGRRYLLYLGDTGADAVERSQNLRAVWQAVAPLIRAGQLTAIFLEASYSNTQPEGQLFGHLTPALLLQELEALGQLTGPTALRGLPVVVTHTKPGHEAAVRQQLTEANKLGLKLVFPEQGRRLEF